MQRYLVLAIGMIVVISILSSTLLIQQRAISGAAEVSRGGIAQQTKISATTLEIWSQGEEFGVYSEQDLEDILENCGSDSGITGLEEEERVITVSEDLESDNLPECFSEQLSEREFRFLFIETPITVESDRKYPQGLVVY